MLLINPIEIAPFAREGASLTAALREWERGMGNMLEELARATPALERARRGGIEIRNQARGVLANRNRVRQGVNRARPNAEASLAQLATRNGPGASRKISRAENNSSNPGAHVVEFDPNRPFQSLTASLERISRENRALAREQAEADRRERRRER